jgi:hypothetical protein
MLRRCCRRMRNPLRSCRVLRLPSNGHRGLDGAHGLAAILKSRMKLSLVRLVATLLLSGQMFPVGLPLFCGQVQRTTSGNCEQQMASHRSGPTVDATSHATPCANPAFCAITASAALWLNARISVNTRESHIVSFGLSTLVPADPQPPLPPPPQA